MSHKIINSQIGYNFIGLIYDAGSAFEKPGRYGISHLMEHLICKRFDDMREVLKSKGIDYNAFTSENLVMFHFSGLEEYLSIFAQTLVDKITNQSILWTKESFDNEKATVLQEYGDCFNDQNIGTYYNLSRKYYNNYGPIGLRSDIEAFTYEDSLKEAQFYCFPSKVVEVVKHTSMIGDIKFSEPNKEKNILKFGNYDVPLEDVPKEDKTFVGMIGNNALDVSLLNKLKLIVNCLTGGLETPFYKEIRENSGLSYFSSGFNVHSGSKFFPLFFASTSNENADKLKMVYDKLFLGGTGKLITKNNFNANIDNLEVNKKLDLTLPHNGVINTELYGNPYEGMDSFTYEEAIELANKYLNTDTMFAVNY